MAHAHIPCQASLRPCRCGEDRRKEAKERPNPTEHVYGAIRTVSRVEAAESTGKPLSYVQPLGAHQTEALAESPRDSSIIHACLSEASRRSSAAVFAVRSTEYSIFFGRRASGAAWFRPWGDDGGWIPRLLCSTEHPATNSVKDIQKD